MLEPNNRFMLVDALRPPSGHRLDAAVGTSFTLDLDALLLATLSFAVYDRVEGNDGSADPIALLESVRRHASNISLFAQAGALSGPSGHAPILSYLEESVIPVRPPRPGFIFHPKVWALRFVNDMDQASYRLLIMSRNLTFASSWDTIVQLDGRPTPKTVRGSSPVGEFIAGLPKSAVHPLSSDRATQVQQMADDLRTVKWELPPDVKWMKFHPMGPDFTSPTIAGDRLLVISPFLSPNMMSQLGANPGQNLLVSRPHALDAIGSAGLAGFSEIKVLETIDPIVDSNPDSNPDSKADSDSELAADVEVDPPSPGSELSGLHAKVYVTENEDYTRLWMGSANATGAAFDGNAEFVVELGLDSSTTIDEILQAGGESSLESMLSPYTPQSVDAVDPTDEEVAIGRIDAALRELASLGYTVDVSPNGEQYRLDFGWDQPADGMRSRLRAHGIEVTIGPATQANFRAAFAETGATLPSVSLQAITSFLVLEAHTKVGGREVGGRTLVNARLSGAPEDRNEQLLASLLDDPDKVLRYLMFLLAELTGDSSLLDAFCGGGGSFDWSSADSAPPLMETLLRALARDPESLDTIADFVEDLGSSKAGRLLPPGFDEVWQPVRSAKEQLS